MIVDFKLVYLGEEKRMAFRCKHCDDAGKKQSSYDTYNRPTNAFFQKAGECTTCEGTGYAPDGRSRRCPECYGAGLCAVCHGQPYRAWSDLSSEMRERWISRWEKRGNFPTEYAAVATFYRNW